MTEYDKHLLTSNGYSISEVLTWKDKGADLLKTLRRPNKKGGYMKPVNMATGGLMNRPLGYKSEDKQDSGISAYDVSTPESARQGMPSRVLGKDRTRFTGGGFTQADLDLLKSHKYKASEVAKWKDGGKELLKSLRNMYVLKSKGGEMNKKGLLKRMGYNKAGPILPLDPDDIPELEEADDSGIVPTSEKFAGGNSARDNLINKRIDKLEAELEIADTGQQSEIVNQIKKLESMKSTNIRTAALGGYMDENDIAEQTPLALSIGGQAALGEKYDRRKDYQAYAEGDEVIAEEEMIEEPLMAPTGMDTDSPMLEEDIDAIGETETEMMAEDEMQDADSVLDTSALSEDEESIFNEALEMFPELEAILPKVIATEFTEDELVEGPGTGTSDSIPALLSDGEFVFTAKAVKNIGIDKLRKMMKQAEEAYDAGMVEQEDAATMASEEESLLA